MQHSWRVRDKDIDHASRLFIAIHGLVTIARRHLNAEKPIALSALAEQLHLPEPLVRVELTPFVKDELLVSARRGNESTYSLGRDVDSIHLGEILRLLECSWKHAPVVTDSERRLRALLESQVMTRDAATEQLTLRELVRRYDSSDATSVSETPT
jgi:DNA-binding IscR family transcriptional regulator